MIPDPTKKLLCTLCDKEAITTAAHIPVCEEHFRLYQEEGIQYLADRPFYDKLKQAYALNYPRYKKEDPLRKYLIQRINKTQTELNDPSRKQDFGWETDEMCLVVTLNTLREILNQLDLHKDVK